MHDVISILKLVFSWPFIVFLIIMYFRHGLSDLLNKLIEAKEITIGKYFKALFDKDAYPPSQISPIQEIPKEIGKGKYEDKYGDVYWSGHDFMWTINATMIGKDKTTIMRGLMKILQHLEVLDFSGTLLFKDLETIKFDVEKTPPSELNASTRTYIVEGLWRLKNQFGEIIQLAQKDYKP
jgi:hypothetical protein